MRTLEAARSLAIVALLTLATLPVACSSTGAPADRPAGDAGGQGDGTGSGQDGGQNACEAAGGVCGDITCRPGYHADDGELTASNVCNPCPPGAPCAQFPCCLPDGPDGGADAGVDLASDAAADAGDSSDGAGDDGSPDLTDVGPAPDRTPVNCGTMTCGADEVCVIQCTCCGIPTDMAPSADYRCEPIPAGCLGDADPCACGKIGCDFSSTGSCPGGQRTVECPCA